MRLTQRIGIYLFNWEQNRINAPTVAILIYLHWFSVGLYINAPERNRVTLNSWLEVQHLRSGYIWSKSFGLCRNYEILLRQSLRKGAVA